MAVFVPASVGFYMYLSVVYAQSEQPKSPYEQLFYVCVGILVALIAAYTRSVEKRVAANELNLSVESGRINGVREVIIGQHYRKEEIDDRFDKLEKMIADSRRDSLDSLTALHGRFDLLHVPRTKPADGRQ